MIKYVACICCLAALSAADAGRVSFDAGAPALKTFRLDQRAGSSQVAIFSETPLDDFTSVVNQVGGELRLDPAHLDTLRARFYFRLTDLKTGIEARDQEMLSPAWLDAARFPLAVLNLTKVEQFKLISSTRAEMTLLGTCSLHGVTREVRVPITLAYLESSPRIRQKLPGDVIRIRGQVDIRLSDYGVNGPSGSNLLGVRVSDLQKLRFTVFGSTDVPTTRATS